MSTFPLQEELHILAKVLFIVLFFVLFLGSFWGDPLWRILDHFLGFFLGSLSSHSLGFTVESLSQVSLLGFPLGLRAWAREFLHRHRQTQGTFIF